VSGGVKSPFLAFLALTATAAGALVMVVEIMGSRVIGPFFGATLFVWTSLITVTLVALGLGYAAGGWLADRKGTPDVLYALLFAAGVSALLVPLLRAPVIRAAAPLGLRAGALAASAVLFGPCLLLLGSASPFFVKIAASELSRVGRTVGAFAALSTLGSVIGSALTGFVLIAYLGVRGVFTLVGAVLIGLALVYFAGMRRRFRLLPALVLPLFLAAASGAPASKQLAGGGSVERLLRREGFYGTLQVLDYRYGAARMRDLVLDGLAQSGIDLDSGASVYEYTYHLERLLLGMRPGAQRALVIGLGAGVIPRSLEARGVTTDVVEINQEIVDVARRYFGFTARGAVHVQDARLFLARPGRRYDYIVLDAFGGDQAAPQLLTLEAAQLLRERLAEGGLLGINLIGGVGRESLATASIVRTLREVFLSVELFAAFDVEAKAAFGNVLLVARAGPPLPFVPERVRDLPVHPYVRASVERFLGRRVELPAGTPALLITDDYNPLDTLELWSKEGLRRAILGAVDWDMLL
jgi:spermidine synthase